jgi:hypothetical protein
MEALLMRTCQVAKTGVTNASKGLRAPFISQVGPMRCFTSTPYSQQHARTGLYDFHIKNEGKMVPFSGYDMPLSYGSVGQGES